MTVNGDLTLNTTSAVTKIAGGTTFTTAHLAGNASRPRLCTGTDAAGTILFDGASPVPAGGGDERDGGQLHRRPTGVIRTNAGLTGDGHIGGSQNFGGAMALTNNGLISAARSAAGPSPSVAASLANSATGILEATGGGILTINSTNWSNAGNLRVNGSTANLNGGPTWAARSPPTPLDAAFGAASTPNLGTLSRRRGTVNVTGPGQQRAELHLQRGDGLLDAQRRHRSAAAASAFADSKNLVIAANTQQPVERGDGQRGPDAE